MKKQSISCRRNIGSVKLFHTHSCFFFPQSLCPIIYTLKIVSNLWKEGALGERVTIQKTEHVQSGWRRFLKSINHQNNHPRCKMQVEKPKPCSKTRLNDFFPFGKNYILAHGFSPIPFSYWSLQLCCVFLFLLF